MRRSTSVARTCEAGEADPKGGGIFAYVGRASEWHILETGLDRRLSCVAAGVPTRLGHPYTGRPWRQCVLPKTTANGRYALLKHGCRQPCRHSSVSGIVFYVGDYEEPPRSRGFFVVPEVGLEPTPPGGDRILSLSGIMLQLDSHGAPICPTHGDFAIGHLL